MTKNEFIRKWIEKFKHWLEGVRIAQESRKIRQAMRYKEKREALVRRNKVDLMLHKEKTLYQKEVKKREVLRPKPKKRTTKAKSFYFPGDKEQGKTNKTWRIGLE